jgi:hypothetical protein
MKAGEKTGIIFLILFELNLLALPLWQQLFIPHLLDHLKKQGKDRSKSYFVLALLHARSYK